MKKIIAIMAAALAFCSLAAAQQAAEQAEVRQADTSDMDFLDYLFVPVPDESLDAMPALPGATPRVMAFQALGSPEMMAQAGPGGAQVGGMMQRPDMGPGGPGPVMMMQGGPEGGKRVIITRRGGDMAGGFGPGMAGMGPMGPGKWWKNSELMQKLGVTDEQVQKIEKIFQDQRIQLIDLHAALDKQEALLEPLVEADQPNESQVLSGIEKIAQARANLEKSNAQMLLAVRRVLSVDQWKKLSAEPGLGNVFFYRTGPGISPAMPPMALPAPMPGPGGMYRPMNGPPPGK